MNVNKLLQSLPKSTTFYFTLGYSHHPKLKKDLCYNKEIKIVIVTCKINIEYIMMLLL